jgi:5'-deoxynucleotidase YfbR-like HD superfamily hydrolase
MQRDLVDLVTKIREGSAVERAHTLPHHGSYSVGKHSYDAVMLLFTLHPSPTMELVKAVLSHDLGERWCGDIPAPTKWSDGEFAKRSGALEKRCLAHLGYDISLTAEDVQWLNAVDKLELLLWAKEQIAMGNQNAASCVGNLLAWFKASVKQIPEPVRDFISNHKWSRTPDVLPK